MPSIKRKKLILIFSILILLILITSKEKQLIITVKNKVINTTNINNKEKELLIITIPKINLTRKIYSLNSPNNNINKNIQLLISSNISKNTFILASHSGTNNNAYFNNLYKLKYKDIIYIKKDDIILTYQIKNMYYINKIGYLEIEKNLNNTVILITCSTKYKNKQLIIESALINSKIIK